MLKKKFSKINFKALKKIKFDLQLLSLVIKTYNFWNYNQMKKLSHLLFTWFLSSLVGSKFDWNFVKSTFFRPIQHLCKKLLNLIGWKNENERKIQNNLRKFRQFREPKNEFGKERRGHEYFDSNCQMP